MEKLITPLGTLLICVHNMNVKYNFIKLDNNSLVFPNIDGRYKI